MRKAAAVAGKWLVAAILAYVGGMIVFSILFTGSFLGPLSAAVMTSTAFEWTAWAGVWACRIGIFFMILYCWSEERDRRRRFSQK